MVRERDITGERDNWRQKELGVETGIGNIEEDREKEMLIKREVWRKRRYKQK